MISANQIREHMDVVGSDGKHVGRVDKVKGTEIELAKMDLAAMGRHHMIPLSWVESVDDKVHLSCTHDQAKDLWAGKH